MLLLLLLAFFYFILYVRTHSIYLLLYTYIVLIFSMEMNEKGKEDARRGKISLELLLGEKKGSIYFVFFFFSLFSEK